MSNFESLNDSDLAVKFAEIKDEMKELKMQHEKLLHTKLKIQVEMRDRKAARFSDSNDTNVSDEVEPTEE